MSAQTKRAATRKGGGSSSSNGAKTFKFRGVALTLPKEIPGTLGFDIGDIQLRAEEGDVDYVIAHTQRLLEDLITRDELIKVRPTVKGVDDAWQTDLLTTVLKAVGDAGES